MNIAERKMPQWKAPDTLLERVMDRVDKCEQPSYFFNWSALQKTVFCILSIMSMAVCAGLAAFYGNYTDILLYINRIGSAVSSAYQEILIAHAVFHQLVRQYLMQPAVMGIVLIAGVSVLVAWISSIALVNKMLQMQLGRKYI